MAQGETLDFNQPQIISENPNDPLEILKRDLMQSAADNTEQSAVRMADSSRTIVNNRVASDVDRTQPQPNEPTSVYYDRIAMQSYVTSLPAGSVITSKSPNLRTRTMPDGRIEVTVINPPPSPSVPVPSINPVTFTSDSVRTASTPP